MKRLSVLAAVVLVVHAWEGSAVSVSPLVSCNPDCAGVNNGDKVVNPKNCTQYFFCNQGVAYGPNSCDPGTHFEVTDGACVAGEECTSICGAGAGCPLTCNDTLLTVGDAFDCSSYYICTPGSTIPQTCPADRPYYDANSHVCVNDESVCCTGYCQPYCDGTQPVVPDPTDCTRFYFCDDAQQGEATGGISPAVSCDPDCTGTVDGDKVVNPYNCGEFYYCIGGAPAECPTARPLGTVCLGLVCPSAPCEPDCTGTPDDDKVVNPRNCREFYYCIDGAPVEPPTSCSDGNYFDSTTSDCVAGSCESICQS